MSKTGQGKLSQKGDNNNLLAIDLLGAKTSLIIDWGELVTGSLKNVDLFYPPDHNAIFCKVLQCKWWNGGVQYRAVVEKNQKPRIMTGLYVGEYVIHQREQPAIDWDEDSDW